MSLAWSEIGGQGRPSTFRPEGDTKRAGGAWRGESQTTENVFDFLIALCQSKTTQKPIYTFMTMTDH